MREIKFRVYDENEGMFLVDGLIGTAKGLKVCSVLAIPEKCDYECWSPIPDEWEYTSNDIIMQYTGLKDENGVEVYEGDILHCWGEDDSYIDDNDNEIFNKQIGVVKWGNSEYPAFDIYTKAHGQYIDSLSDDYNSFADGYYHYEVIGNIYENPELLNK